ncbi:MAG TPA: class I tRNA ligase family protein [Candidatus Elarobacter sp.]
MLNTFVRAMHPIAPFVTEEIWQTLPHDGATIVTASWPDLAEIPSFPEAVPRFDALMKKVEDVRNYRSEFKLNPKQGIQLEVDSAFHQTEESWYLRVFANASYTAKIEIEERLPQIRDEAIVKGDVLSSVTIKAPAGVLRERYARDVTRLESEVARSEKKLANESFIEKASPDVVAAERAKLDRYRAQLERSRLAVEALSDEL